jgi:hypothetical protein
MREIASNASAAQSVKAGETSRAHTKYTVITQELNLEGRKAGIEAGSQKARKLHPASPGFLVSCLTFLRSDGD